ncbi:MAG: protein-tyrosine-phosphatase [Cyclobacteriaceae bacterium]
MKDKLNILFVCGRNKRRSKTASQIFRNDLRFKSRSAGFSPKSPHQLSSNDIEWADLIFVMEGSHKNRLMGMYRDWDLPKIEVLSIPDDYDYIDTEFNELLEIVGNDYLRIFEKI